jgi:hypothetical protein
MTGARLRTLAIVAVTMVCACSAAPAGAAQSAKLTATLRPERLGHGTTLGFGFQIDATPGHVPSPVVAIDLSYPPDLGIALSGLGVETCSLSLLQSAGLNACPTDSHMGYGDATVEIPIGPDLVRENAGIAIVRAPVDNGHFALMFYADGTNPVQTQLVLPALLLAAAEPFGGRFAIQVPLVEGLPEAPDVALVSLHSTLGPAHLTYYEQVHGNAVAYSPRGVQLPKRCPRGGFPFAATFAFLDGTRTTAHATVPCPR